MTQLSWQLPPVTKCGECKFHGKEHEISFCIEIDKLSKDGFTAELAESVYNKNKNGITESCPMWQEQNKDKIEVK